MDKTANQPQLDGPERMPKARPLVRAFSMFFAVAEFGAAISMLIRHGLWPAEWWFQGLFPAASLAFIGYCAAVVGVTGYQPFRRKRTTP
jgi:hypothetical protein